jgi:hypothetical protein
MGVFLADRQADLLALIDLINGDAVRLIRTKNLSDSGMLIGSEEIADGAELAFALALTFQIQVEGFEVLDQGQEILGARVVGYGVERVLKMIFIGQKIVGCAQVKGQVEAAHKLKTF